MNYRYLACFVASLYAVVPATSGGQEVGNAAFVEKGVPRGVREIGRKWKPAEGYLEGAGADNFLVADKSLEKATFAFARA